MSGTPDWAPSMPLPPVSAIEAFITPVEDPGPNVTNLKYDRFDSRSCANVRFDSPRRHTIRIRRE